jgi:hypothetical protein
MLNFSLKFPVTDLSILVMLAFREWLMKNHVYHIYHLILILGPMLGTNDIDGGLSGSSFTLSKMRQNE